MKSTDAVRDAKAHRLTDVFQRLEQGRPIALTCAGSNTAYQGAFSDVPYSTWGFEPFGGLLKQVELYHHVYHVFSQRLRHYASCFRANSPWNPSEGLRLDASCSTRSNEWIEEIGRHSSHVPNAMETNSNIELFASILVTVTHEVSQVFAKVKEEKLVAELTDADFLEPPSFGWTRSGFEARAAARNFSEGIYADH